MSDPSSFLPITALFYHRHLETSGVSDVFPSLLCPIPMSVVIFVFIVTEKEGVKGETIVVFYTSIKRELNRRRM